MSDIDDMFEKFEERKEKRKEEVGSRTEEFNHYKAKAEEVLNIIIIPALEEVVEQIKSKGYWATINKELHFPISEVKFGFDTDSDPGKYPNSYIHIIFREDIGVELIRNACFGGRDNKQDSISYKLSDVTQEIIKTEALTLVQTVLENKIL